MLRMLGRGVKEEEVKPGQLRKWFAPGEQFIIITSIQEETGRCTVKNMTIGHSESFKIEFVKNISTLVADIETVE
jgi:hypothetical protein